MKWRSKQEVGDFGSLVGCVGWSMQQHTVGEEDHSCQPRRQAGSRQCSVEQADCTTSSHEALGRHLILTDQAGTVSGTCSRERAHGTRELCAE